MLSLLDGLSGYKQVMFSHANEWNKTFRTKWVTYAYQNMPFGLINVGTTFQREMAISFHRLIGKSVVVYLDDVTFFTKNKINHVNHLKQIFDRFKRYDISLNPKKSIFIVDEGRLLGLIVSKFGIMIKPERT
jgi:hypothetical protein